MKAKLTLSIDEEVIRFARRQARQSGKSVSGMFSAYVRDRQARLEHREVLSAEAMVGSLKPYTINDSKQAVRQAYANKHST